MKVFSRTYQPEYVLCRALLILLDFSCVMGCTVSWVVLCLATGNNFLFRWGVIYTLSQHCISTTNVSIERNVSLACAAWTVLFKKFSSSNLWSQNGQHNSYSNSSNAFNFSNLHSLSEIPDQIFENFLCALISSN